MIELNLLPHGLRHVLVHVTLGGDFPPLKDSPSDIALLRAANLAMQRMARGTEDAFLFVTVGRHDYGQVAEALAAYGFPKVSVVCIEADDVNRRLEFGEETLPAEVDQAIETWLNLEHTGAIARVCEDYPAGAFWWSGVEYDDDVFDWPFDAGDFAKELPDQQHSKAATWLTILGHAVNLHETQACGPDGLGRDIAAVWAAALCEWLHGFEAASGNSYNAFGYETNSNLYPSAFFLGFELARLSGNNLEAICEEAESDVDNLASMALKAITQDKRDELRAALSDFFGGDGVLYFALYSAIWPDFSKPMTEAMNQLLGTDDHDDLAELDAGWRFVTEGWCDESDD